MFVARNLDERTRHSLFFGLLLIAHSAQFTPFAARTQQFVKEQLGQADEKTQLPDDYLELEKRVDALKQVHQKLLSVTYVYIDRELVSSIQ